MSERKTTEDRAPSAKSKAKTKTEIEIVPDFQDFTLSDERALAIVQERAMRLAKIEEKEKTLGNLEVIVFQLNAERYAIETRFVREILGAPHCTRVPRTPDFVAGVINLHGQIVALIDLRRFFGLPFDQQAHHKIIVLGEERTEFAIMADGVEQVMRLETTELQEALDCMSSNSREHILGITMEALIVINGQTLLTDRRLFINQTSDFPK